VLARALRARSASRSIAARARTGTSSTDRKRMAEGVAGLRCSVSERAAGSSRSLPGIFTRSKFIRSSWNTPEVRRSDSASEDSPACTTTGASADFAE